MGIRKARDYLLLNESEVSERRFLDKRPHSSVPIADLLGPVGAIDVYILVNWTGG